MRTTPQHAILLFAVLLFGAGSAFGQSAENFYVTMLQRGIGSAAASQNEKAARELKIAAFGLIDSIEYFEMAHVHLAIVTDRLGRADDARAAALRVLAAERVQRKYATLEIAAATRTQFEAVVKKVLGPDQLTQLKSTAGTTPSTTTPSTTPASSTPARTPAPSQTKPATTTTTPATTANTAPPKPQPQPPASTPARTATTTTTKPATTTPATASPAVAARLSEAEQFISRNRLTDARRIYRELLSNASLDRASLLGVAEGSYRTRDFETTVSAFSRLGTLRDTERPYRYYYAVALFETGDRAGAKRELAAAIPFIEMTADVARYRDRIENAAE